MKILITGSNGYIGSCLYNFLKKKRYKVFGLDKRITNKFIIGKQFKCNLLDINKSKKIIQKINPDIFIHLAGESTIDNISNKKEYIDNNVTVTKNLIKICKNLNIKKFIFSSTAAVYRQTNLQIKENFKTKPSNIYGKTKLKCEKDLIAGFNKTNINLVIFRFFNVCSSLYNVGENHEPETHLVPLIVQKYYEKKKLKIYGKNFKTKDKTCIRDYIHIKDICFAFLKCVNIKLKDNSTILNLGSNKGYSVLELVNFFKKKIELEFSNKRVGDLDKLICVAHKAKKTIGWSTKYSNISNIFNDEIRWFKFLKKKKLKRITLY
tara:strand:+ start:303 stop:1265 length:963 start_codon:yes stop_codon:yes gene_type:complete